MAAEILDMMAQSIRAVNTWFITIVNACGMASVIVGFVCVCLAARFILQPIIGGRFFSAASDRVKKSSIGEKE